MSEQPTKRPRVRQACAACRDSKLRCDLGDPGVPKDPPCQRCARTGRSCNFVGSHLQSKPRKMKNRKSVAASSTVEASTSPSAVPRQAESSAASTSPTRLIDMSRAEMPAPAPRVTSPYSSSLGGIGHLETPADALRILCAAANDELAVQAPPPRSSSPHDSKIWSRWEPVRDGLLTADEAAMLLSFFAHHVSPLHPVVPSELFLQEHFTVLLDEPLLLAAVCLAAARFYDLGASFNAAEPSRSKVVQGKLVTWILARLGYLAMGDPTFRTIGTVEALLVLSEWPPRALLVKDPSGKPSCSPSSLPTACKLFDDLAWTLTGMALRIAQELSLQDETTYDAASQWETQRRIDCWINCLTADRHVSVRLGRVSLVQEMSTNYWERLGHIMFTPDNDSYRRRVSYARWRDTQAVSELTHHIGLLQDVLYASPQLTSELVRTRRFEPLLHRLKPELDSLVQWLSPGTVERDVLEESVAGMEQEEIREIRMRIEIDYIRLYANAISMRAAHARLSRPGKSDRSIFGGSVLRWAEAPFLLEVVEAAISLLRCGVALHRRKVLRYCPGRTFLRMMFASVFLMKALSFGAIVPSESEVVDLQYSLIDVFREAAVDSDHLAAQLASLLSRLFPARTAQGTNGPRAASGQDYEDTSDPRLLFNFDVALENMTALGSEMGFDPGNMDDSLGFNPNGLVSFIEAMLGGTDAMNGELFQT